MSAPYCPACACYMPRTLDGDRSDCGCGRTPPRDDLPPNIYVCPVCAGHGRYRWGCWGTQKRPHDHCYMVGLHELALDEQQAFNTDRRTRCAT